MRLADETVMRECLRLARRGEGLVSPNPLVGAVVVESGKIVARGYHARFGSPHAEVECLTRFRGDPARATLFVNLEPCSYHGKTPPCTKAILASGIRKVVVAMVDPNPKVKGNGLGILRRNGIAVRTGVLKKEARQLNRTFIKHVTTGLPYVHLKVARSLDGFIASPRPSRRWITSTPARTLVHRWRAVTDAVLVGVGTVKTDNPRLNVRLWKGRDPAIVVLDGNCSIPITARVLSGNRRVYLFVDAGIVASKGTKISRIRAKGVNVIPLAAMRGRLSLRSVLLRLSRENIGSVLVEGGGKVFRDFLGTRLVDEMSIFVSPDKLRDGLPFSTPPRKLFKPNRAMMTVVGRDVLIKAWKE